MRRPWNSRSAIGKNFRLRLHWDSPCLATNATSTTMERFCWDAGTSRTGTVVRGTKTRRRVQPRGPTVKIEAITLRETRMPLVHFFETSFGRTTERRILLVTLHTDGPEG